ncbi:hypothetical protein F5Y17DRAFT_189127 [Xylariaceae sp. FL0594]|nr:hypothetical protein F5Y17DRAFT_189127 [Xylariaceae sp. FL0594]
MSRPWILVSPSSRGIGHALAARLLRTTTDLPILATARGGGGGGRSLFDVKASILSAAHSLSPPPSAKPTYSYSTTTREEEDMASRLHVTDLDVTDEDSVRSAAEKARELFPPGSHHLHLAFALPGILAEPEKSPAAVDYEAALEVFRVNALGPLVMMKWFGDMLPRRGTDMTLVPAQAQAQAHSRGCHEHEFKTTTTEGNKSVKNENVTAPPPTTNTPLILPAHATYLTAAARLGSTTDNKLGGWYTYRASKAAVINLTRTFDLHLQARSSANALAVAYHPGTVKTDFTRGFWDSVAPGKLFSPEFAAFRMLQVVQGLRLGDRGRCWDWKGEEILP